MKLTFKTVSGANFNLEEPPEAEVCDCKVQIVAICWGTFGSGFLPVGVQGQGAHRAAAGSELPGC